MTRGEAAGFTLIELMVVVVVVAVLAAVAYPSYMDHVRKAKRAEGKAALLKAAQLEERNYSNSATYTTDLVTLFAATTAVVYSGENPSDPKSSYTITAVGCPIAACFTLTATPNAPFTDPICGNFTLSSTGTRGSNSGTASGTDTCKW